MSSQGSESQEDGRAQVWRIGGFINDAPFEEAIQLEPLPQFQSEKTRAELPGSFQPHFVQQHTRYLRIIRRRSHMRREQFQLLPIALFVEDSTRCQPAGLRRTVQSPEVP